MAKVLFYSMLAEILKRKEVELNIDGELKLEDIVRRAAEEVGAEESLFLKAGKVKKSYIILLNGKSVTFQKDVTVDDHDIVSIIPILTGG